MISPDGIRHLPFGHFTIPDDGDPRKAKVVVCGHLMDHPDGMIILDTGIAEVMQEPRSSTGRCGDRWRKLSRAPA